MSYRWPGLMQAVRPGDVVTLRRYDPERSSGYTEATYLCLWVKHHQPAPGRYYTSYSEDSWYVQFGGLELGRFELVDELIERNEPVEFPWPTRN